MIDCGIVWSKEREVPPPTPLTHFEPSYLRTSSVARVPSVTSESPSRFVVRVGNTALTHSVPSYFR